MDLNPDERRVRPVPDDQFEALAQRVTILVWERVEAAEAERERRIIETLRAELFREFGEYMFKEVAKPTIRRFIQMVGLGILAAVLYWVKAKWGISLPGISIGGDSPDDSTPG